MKYADIQSAIITRWKAGNYGLTTFYPNRPYNPTGDHARITVLTADSEPASLGATGTNRVSGVLQIDLMYTDGRGDGELLEIIDTIMADFQSGAKMAYNGQTVDVWGSQLRAPRSEGGWLRAIISINFTAQVRRS